MAEAKAGDTVRVHYTTKLDRGTVLDSSEDSEPLVFRIGEGKLVQGFEDAVVGMTPGQSKTVRVPPERAYGAYRQDLELELDRSKFPEGFEPEIGQRLEICEEDGRVVPVEVLDVFDQTVVVNANHPLAGVELIFDIHLLDII
ncbi:MAG: FKBP-type peptidyl-prolyl cis-trans isomerase [Methanosaeta sp. PtaB.Bin039]|nr:MAG: FKBP-type peptidyl-prolyl cis-trans isomerase [Methanosaeta sp. PtaB.Bin039]OPY44979.1 MAG: FKBP-type peptidyl-prolyl cis-trans isomerase [Methanosaeta sp. PtaU1.Bin028]HOT07862.1 peptidylprolyl isomerase [Methanotrichaceae archaeon]HQF17561.1 peptidylprolyl isomerase [Methanotrichaceae archaeon]HQI92145.1 peptidylprolyl isomerase [Methanotrichaceae archaeon]